MIVCIVHRCHISKTKFPFNVLTQTDNDHTNLTFMFNLSITYRGSCAPRNFLLFLIQIVDAVVRISPIITIALAIPTYKDPAVLLSKDSGSNTSCTVEPTPCRHILFLRKLNDVLFVGQRDVVTLIWICTSIWAFFKPVQANLILKYKFLFPPITV